jgi:hypothetical protein
MWGLSECGGSELLRSLPFMAIGLFCLRIYRTRTTGVRHVAFSPTSTYTQRQQQQQQQKQKHIRQPCPCLFRSGLVWSGRRSRAGRCMNGTGVARNETEICITGVGNVRRVC